jgi:hypothetical protein
MEEHLGLHWAPGSFVVALLVNICAGFIQFWNLSEITEQVNLKSGPRHLDPFVLSPPSDAR